MLGITVADCIPLFAVNPEHGVVGLAHCGWRGVASGIVEGFVTHLKDLAAAIEPAHFMLGASVGSCCYEVKHDLLARFSQSEVQRCAEIREGRTFFDLRSVVVSRLVALGVRPDKISVDMTCTSCKNDVLSSYRASGTECGRMLAVVMLND
jgi:YfiH family protein